MKSLTLIALIASILPAGATVTLFNTGRQYSSRPASFGMSFEYGLQYEALLQIVEGDEHLCHGINDTMVDSKRRPHDEFAGTDFSDGRHLAEIEEREAGVVDADVVQEIQVNEGIRLDTGNQGNNKNGTDDRIHVVPSHGVPVALLAKRGQCSYETKARVASTLTSPHGAVRFVIVYNDDPDGGLITMMPRENGEGAGGHDLYKNLGLLFVGFSAGMDLKDYISAQPQYTIQSGGPRILLDGEDRWFPAGAEPAAGLAMLLMLFGCICSLSLFLSTTALGGREDNVFLLDGRRDAQRATAARRRRRRGNGLRLLTLEEVETLPTREYSTGEESPNNSLELRDKSDLPYEEEDGLHTEEAATAEGGGLCASLLPCKPESYGHNSCSICLDEYEVGEPIRVLPCQHTFHSECIFPWLTERSPTCPLCKAMFEAVQYDEEQDGEEGEEEQMGSEEEGTGMPSPPLEDEPDVHSGGRRLGSRRNSSNGGTDPNIHDADQTAGSPQGRTSSLRSRLFGLFGSSSRSPPSRLEEPLLPNDDVDIA